MMAMITVDLCLCSFGRNFSKHIMIYFILLAHSRALSRIFGNLYETINYLAKKFQVVVMEDI